jgi:iron transport multicopper oxidase
MAITLCVSDPSPFLMFYAGADHSTGHIEWHFEAGLAVTFVEAPLQLQQRATTIQAPPDSLSQQCLSQNLPASGNAAGHASATDLSGLKLGPFLQKSGFHTKGILALTGCILTAVLGMLTVAWYSMSGTLSEEEVEREVRAAHAAKLNRGRLFGLVKRK